MDTSETILSNLLQLFTQLVALTEDGDKSQEADQESDRQEDKDKRIQLVLVSLLVERVGSHGVVVVVEVASRHRSRLETK